ncbi:uncharacterized protein LOC142364120 [Opisthocomus hoazin]|uniref:uncharacterized protein LOC142364120 n=1 Tax=Opisthocomus hoazin TaxID=30419 RepID=UPI003F5388AD
MEEGREQSPPWRADWGCTWVAAIVKEESRRVGEGTREEGGGKTARPGRGRGREREARALPASRRAQTRACGHVPPQPPRQPLPLPRPPSPCPPGFACQARVGTAPPAAPNKAVAHPRAGADSKQSDRRIFRMLIQTARRRASGGGPPPFAMHRPPPSPPPRTPPLAPAGLVPAWRGPSGGRTEASRSARFKPSRSRGSAGKRGHSASAVPVPAAFISPWNRDKSALASGGLSKPRVCNPLQEVGTDPSPNPTRRERRGREIEMGRE